MRHEAAFRVAVVDWPPHFSMYNVFARADNVDKDGNVGVSQSADVLLLLQEVALKW